jgi:hypothetical protein
LTLHDGQLPSEDDGANQATKSDCAGQTNHPPVASVDAFYQRLLGYSLLPIGYGLMCWGIAAFYRRRRWRGMLLVCVSAVVAYQAVWSIFW